MNLLANSGQKLLHKQFHYWCHAMLSFISCVFFVVECLGERDEGFLFEKN